MTTSTRTAQLERFFTLWLKERTEQTHRLRVELRDLAVELQRSDDAPRQETDGK